MRYKIQAESDKRFLELVDRLHGIRIIPKEASFFRRTVSMDLSADQKAQVEALGYTLTEVYQYEIDAP
jgi:hypothetical protein